MGCANVSCSISNLSIGYKDKVKFIFLKKQVDSLTNLTSVINSTDFFKPVYLPVTGEYNDYGALENVVRDYNVELIEKDLGANIEDIIKAVDRGRYEGDKYGLSGMFVLDKVYNDLAEYELNREALIKSYLNEYSLLKMGFEEHEYVDDYKIFIHSNCPIKVYFKLFGSKVVINDDETILKEKYNLDSEIYYVENLKHIMDVVFKELQIDYNELLKQSTYEIGLNDNLNYIKEYYLKDKDLDDSKSYLFINKISSFELLKKEKLYIQPLIKDIDNDLKDKYIKFIAFDKIMVSCNRFYFPSCIGEQCGDTQASKALLNISNEIINKRLIEEEEY